MNTLSILGTGISLERGDVVIWFAYAALTYFLWRYWIHAQEHHRLIREDFDQELNNDQKYRSMIDEEIEKFTQEAGAADAEEVRENDSNSISSASLPWDPMKKNISLHWLRPILKMKINNRRGDFHPDNKQVSLKITTFYSACIGTILKACVRRKAFSEIALPYLLAALAVISIAWEGFNSV